MDNQRAKLRIWYWQLALWEVVVGAYCRGSKKEHSLTPIFRIWTTCNWCRSCTSARFLSAHSLICFLFPPFLIIITINSDGFIAGVCNPAFADRPTWWDVLCNMETGKIIVSKTIEQPKISHRSWIKTASGGLEGYSEKSGNGEEEKEKEKVMEKGQGKVVDTPDGPFMEEVSRDPISLSLARFLFHQVRITDDVTIALHSIDPQCHPISLR